MTSAKVVKTSVTTSDNSPPMATLTRMIRLQTQMPTLLPPCLLFHLPTLLTSQPPPHSRSHIAYLSDYLSPYQPLFLSFTQLFTSVIEVLKKLWCCVSGRVEQAI